MSRYIDAEAFFKLINTTLPYRELDYPDKAIYNAAISDMCGMLTHFPAADVVEVVRCRDCKYYIEREDGYICANDYWYKESDWFCADGERNE